MLAIRSTTASNDATIVSAVAQATPIDVTTAVEPEESTVAQPPLDVDIWELAYQHLSKENPGLVKHYEEILAQEEADQTYPSSQNEVSQSNISHSISRLTTLASKKLAGLDDSRLKIRLRSRTLVIKDGVDQLLTIVIAAKDFVSGAVALEPHGAIAWAGVCVLLPVSCSHRYPS